MNTDNVTTWHELRDQLTPEQIAELEKWEANPNLPVAAGAPAWAVQSQQESMLFAAKEYAKLNAGTEQAATVPVPAGATAEKGWTSVALDGVLVRSLEWSRHDTANGISVSVDGFQRATGEYERGISFYGVSEGEPINAAHAREFAAALLAAADELDKLDGPHSVDSRTRKCCGGIGGHGQGCLQ